jgi:ABC-type transport system involved in cytochrome bd biosynthesis fused ATPase/permease subunit
MANPFFVGKPVPATYFIGRRKEVATAFDIISKSGHLAIYGSPGMGKSSLLQLLATPEIWRKHGYDSAMAIIISLNCTSVDPFTPNAFWREILSLIGDIHFIGDGMVGDTRD